MSPNEDWRGMSSEYVPKEYWDNRLKQRWNLTGVGYGGYSARYNKWLYRFQEHSLARALDHAGVEVEGRRVLDIGSGIGYWVRWYYSQRAASVTSVDITPTAVQNLRTLYPQATVLEGDVSSAEVEIPPHDIVNIISVLFHIVDPAGFGQALANLARFTAPGGHLVLSDRMGDSELRPAEHVCFRPRSVYESELPKLGFEIRYIQPMHTLMNGGLMAAFNGAPALVRGLARRTEEYFTPALFLFDKLPGLSRWANSHILVARKIAGD
jgi:SAM-dependent methyltransferase